jgi:membrane associated rhomboid family serine protease
MIPIRDAIQSTRYPVVNNTIIGLNVLLFLVELSQGDTFTRFILTYGLVPARYSVPEIAAYFSSWQQVLALFSFMFLHGGFWHLLGNMWSLYIFGDNVEDRLGPLRYLLFYVLCGWASGLSHLFLNWHSQVPTIGASGAIAGVMGAYLVLYPRARILTLIPIFIIPYFAEIPAFFFLGIWVLFQFFSAAAASGQSSGIAWWAHIGGFLFGIVFLKLFLSIPETGLTLKLRRATSKTSTPRLQLIRTTGFSDDPHLYGEIIITPREAQYGTSKLVNIPWGLRKRLFRVAVPSKVHHGTILRLAGMGKLIDGGRKGDLYLKVLIHPTG